MGFNLTNVTGAETWAEVVVAVNQQTSDVLGVALLISIYAIVFISMVNRDIPAKSANAAAAFLNITIVMLLFPTGLIQTNIVFISTVIVGLSAAALYYQR